MGLFGLKIAELVIFSRFYVDESRAEFSTFSSNFEHRAVKMRVIRVNADNPRVFCG